MAKLKKNSIEYVFNRTPAFRYLDPGLVLKDVKGYDELPNLIENGETNVICSLAFGYSDDPITHVNSGVFCVGELDMEWGAPVVKNPYLFGYSMDDGCVMMPRGRRIQIPVTDKPNYYNDGHFAVIVSGIDSDVDLSDMSFNIDHNAFLKDLQALYDQKNRQMPYEAFAFFYPYDLDTLEP